MTEEKEPYLDHPSATEQDATWRNTSSVDWLSPPEVLAAARNVMGKFDLDPASSEKANQFVRAEVFFGQDNGTDGLQMPWRGRVWLNPPYGKYKPGVSRAGMWGKKLLEEYIAGKVIEACLYVKTAVGYKWFDKLLQQADAVCFLWGLPEHLNLVDNRYGKCKMGRAVMYYGSHPAQFVQCFRHLGYFRFDAADRTDYHVLRAVGMAKF